MKWRPHHDGVSRKGVKVNFPKTYRADSNGAKRVLHRANSCLSCHSHDERELSTGGWGMLEDCQCWGQTKPKKGK